MKRLLIKCPTCEEKGIKQNLAEVLETGLISVQRIRKGPRDLVKYRDHTVVGGTNMYILCGNCGSKCFVRNQ